MTLGAARLVAGAQGWRIERQPGPDLAAYLTGRPVAEVALLLPRLFNLCRCAQAQAARLALQLPPAPRNRTDDDHRTPENLHPEILHPEDLTTPDLTTEVIGDHMARLWVTLRRAFGLAPLVPPLLTPAMMPALFGPAGQLPRDLAGLQGWLAQEGPLPELGRAVQARFAPGQGVTPALPAAAPQAGAFENSPAQRQARHPLLLRLAQAQGRGPLWRYLGVLADLQAALAHALPPPQRLADGTAVVPAARGSYFLRLPQQAGLVTGLARLTPTDHQMAPGGALDLALRALPGDAPADQAGALVALFDPCIPVAVAKDASCMK